MAPGSGAEPIEDGRRGGEVGEGALRYIVLNSPREAEVEIVRYLA